MIIITIEIKPIKIALDSVNNNIIDNSLTNKQKILYFIRKMQFNGISVYSKNIQKYLRIGKSYASNLLKELEKEGLISRETQGKWKQIFLTEKGLIISNSQLYSLLTSSELQAFRDYGLLKL